MDSRNNTNSLSALIFSDEEKIILGENDIVISTIPITKITTIIINEACVCDACGVTEKKNIEIDWKERESELLILCDKYRSRNGNYDCLVPGSGGKDSFYASHILKY